MRNVDPRWVGAGLAAALAVLCVAGCAAKQRVSLACVPQDVVVYVDGRELEETPEELSLTRKEPHTLFFKGGGYQPQMVVLESQEREGEVELVPSDVCSRTVFTGMEPRVEMELDPEAERAGSEPEPPAAEPARPSVSEPPPGP